MGTVRFCPVFRNKKRDKNVPSPLSLPGVGDQHEVDVEETRGNVDSTISRIRLYDEIEKEYILSCQEQGVQFAQPPNPRKRLKRIQHLAKKGALVRNKAASVSINAISDACIACTGGSGSKTFFLSLQCNRNCYFCFNPNQQDFEKHLSQINDLEKELNELVQQGRHMTHIALTGGEPLLHPKETIRFFASVQDHYPGIHTRLYTSGDLLDDDLLEQLHNVCLTEIRFSVKLDDAEELQKRTLENIRRACGSIPQVMVEMPVIPGTEKEMRALLRELDAIGIFGINLLEFCFPRHNWEEFEQRGFRVKNPPFPVLYNYGYAGGLPIAGSDELALALVEFALEEKLAMGVHYCSLENKHRDEIYQANMRFAQRLPCYDLDREDFFLKSIVVFGDDVAKVRNAANRRGAIPFEEDPEDHSLQFHPQFLPNLRHVDAQFYTSYNVIEYHEGESYVRELKLELC